MPDSNDIAMKVDDVKSQSSFLLFGLKKTTYRMQLKALRTLSGC